MNNVAHVFHDYNIAFILIFAVLELWLIQLGFLNFWNFNGRNDQEGQTALPCQISRWSISRYWDFAIFRFFKMTIAAILDFQNLGILGVGRVK